MKKIFLLMGVLVAGCNYNSDTKEITKAETGITDKSVQIADFYVPDPSKPDPQVNGQTVFERREFVNKSGFYRDGAFNKSEDLKEFHKKYINFLQANKQNRFIDDFRRKTASKVLENYAFSSGTAAEQIYYVDELIATRSGNFNLIASNLKSLRGKINVEVFDDHVKKALTIAHEYEQAIQKDVQLYSTRKGVTARDRKTDQLIAIAAKQSLNKVQTETEALETLANTDL